MAHQAQRDFFETTKQKFPHKFKAVTVYDFGSLDVNGSLKGLFDEAKYVGIDIVPGKNVNVVAKAHEFTGPQADTVISGEMLEHDEYWRDSLKNMYDLCKPGGLIALSCAGEGRPEHGTRKSDGNEWGTGDYYMNLRPKEIAEVYKEEMFTDYYFEENKTSKDTYFYGIKS